VITGADMKRLRERRGWSQAELGAALNAALDRNYGSGSISPWENDKRPVPADVSAFIEELLVDTALPAEEPAPSALPADEPAAGDTPPGGDHPQAAQPPLASGGAWTRACTELWELVATGVGMVGAATGSEAMMVDGQIIAMDSPALGAAWAKLAETNETFRKMLIGMTEGGAWLQVALVTGTTASKMYQNHATRTLAASAAMNGQPEEAMHAA
jgi:transcriptional regulator with XRE-family HTH domain